MTYQAIQAMDYQPETSEINDPEFSEEQLDKYVMDRLGNPEGNSERDVNYDNIERGALGFDGPLGEAEPEPYVEPSRG